MKKLVYLILSIFISQQIGFAQEEIDQPSVGPSYQDHTFYRIKDGNAVSFKHSSWDIAFGIGTFNLGVFINEGVGLSFQSPFPEVELYSTLATDFANVDTAEITRIYNDDVSWAEGAFNHVKEPGDPSDYGWGTYDFQTHQVNGARVFVIKLRNGSYKKIDLSFLLRL